MIMKEVYEEQKALSDRWKTMYYEKKSEVDQLTNNWNELEEWCKNNLGYYGEEIGIVYKYVLDKMKEIKDGNNER